MNDTDTITTPESYSVATDASTLASINSLTVFAAGPKETPAVLGGVHLSRTGTDWAHFTAQTTNRYVVGQLTTTANVGFYKSADDHALVSKWANDATLWIDQTTLKQAVAMAKTNKFAPITIGYDSTRATGYVSVGDTVMYSAPSPGAFPPVGKLFPTEEPNGVETLSINPKWLAMLTKVVGPLSAGGTLKDAPWIFDFFHTDPHTGDTSGPKHKPVLAHVNGDQWEIKVLIQPTLIRR